MALKDNVKSVLKVNRKTFFNPREWMDYDFIKEQTVGVIALAKAIFIPAKPAREETFEEAMQRLNIQEAELPGIQQRYLLQAVFFLLLGLGSAGYAIFHLTNFSFLGFILAVSICVLSFSQAFRNHFWYFQIKHRKLGCTYAEWRSGKPNN